MSIQISGLLTISNKTSSCTFILKEAIRTRVTLLGKLPAKISRKEKFKVAFAFDVSLFVNANEDLNTTIGIEVTNGKKIVKGTLKIYTAGGEHYPDFVVVELDFERSQSAVFEAPLDSLVEEIGDVVSAGDIDILFRDAGTNAANSKNSINLESLGTLAEIMAG